MQGGLVWVTRAQPGADATAHRLRALGHAPLVGSLLVVHPLTPPDEAPGDVAALAFTSANAVRAYARWTSDRRPPVYAVGAATAQAARLVGFSQVSSADGNVSALAAVIASAPPSGLLLHPCAREAAGDLRGALAAAGVSVQPLLLYETCAVEPPPVEVTHALQDARVSVVLLHSPKAARVLARLLATGAPHDLSGVRLLGLSPACLAPLAGLPVGSTFAAAEPTEASLLARL